MTDHVTPGEARDILRPKHSALIACPTCQAPVARSAHRCLQCGGIVTSRWDNPLVKIAVWWPIVMFAVVLLYWRFS